MAMVKIYNSTNLSEIAVIKSKLEAAGLHPFVQNHEHAQMMHVVTLALGGINILVPDYEADDALELILDKTDTFIDSDVFDDYEPPEKLRNQKPYQASLAPVVILMLSGLAIIVFTNVDFLGVIFAAFGLFIFHAQNRAMKFNQKKPKEDVSNES